ncbi:MAG: shikimate dehydrogenase [Armatimonadota bacterium]|nr:shikimate dehydrogenase [Armatimonadota bacterium]MDR7451623.1 shikimate dehydrogenase [Armatimonadota bacterium]MDR7467657.1 shikimate dehydrogenase [Armatimonadota bacterium]MDR7492592.1 shikimate dehydrogenase [Armatimonadota bacterium]MDR7499940.1 shikimate dehydrogenase [Armatimonadota bacterium]
MSPPPPHHGTFAFLIHPLRIEDFARRYPVTRRLPAPLVERVFTWVPPRLVSHITGIRSATGATAEGWFIGLPLTPRTLMTAPLPFVYRRLIQSGRMAEALGAKILGLGAFTKIVGDRGLTVAAHLSIAVTTGNSYTAATAVEGALLAAERMGIAPADATAAVVGATGSIGAACSAVLARAVGRIVLVARTREHLEALQARLRPQARASVAVETEVRRAAREADIVLTVSSATDTLIEPEDLRPGAVVCDVARPRNVSRLVYERRDDVLVIDGGVIEVPGEVEFGFDFGFPPRMVEACMAETMLLALEGRYENFTLGKEISLERVEEIALLARRHGFRMSGFRRFERAIGDEEVERIRIAASRRRPASIHS